MKYELYTTTPRGIKYLVVTRNGYKLSTTRASGYEYDKALELQSELAEHDLTLCDEDSEMYLFRNKYDKLKRRIAEDDVICLDKHNALEAACDLLYKDDVLEQILKATTIGELNRIMINARRSA